MEIDRAVISNILTQAWTALSGPMTMLVISKKLSETEQGFYYTFSSVLALQVFVELGLVTVIIQMASHEWAFLQLGKDGAIVGRQSSFSRVACLLRFACKWYGLAAVLLIVGLNIGGWVFFSSATRIEVHWQSPWIALCSLAGVALMMSPFFSILEGCNQVSSVYTFRLLQGALSTLAVIGSIYIGLGLYALAISALVRLIAGFIFIFWRHRNFFRQLLSAQISDRVSWKDEVWPFQWRLAISWLSGYFIFSLFTPVMFYYHGAKVAGQMGMTLATVAVIESFAYALLSAKAPLFGSLIARKEFKELDSVFLRVLRLGVMSAIITSILLLVAVYVLQLTYPRLADRLLSLPIIILFICSRLINVVINAMALYLRAHKSEPLMMISLGAAVLVGFSTWVLGSRYGPAGAAIGFLVITVAWSFPGCLYSFNIHRKVAGNKQ